MMSPKSILIIVLLTWVMCTHAQAACPTTCPINQQCKTSGSACEACGAFMCEAIIVQTKCYCKPGYYRVENGDCIPKADCTVCPTNEVYQYSGPAPGCDGCGIRCEVISTQPGCYCKTGYSRVNGTCIPNASCPGT